MWSLQKAQQVMQALQQRKKTMEADGRADGRSRGINRQKGMQKGLQVLQARGDKCWIWLAAPCGKCFSAQDLQRGQGLCKLALLLKVRPEHT